MNCVWMYNVVFPTNTHLWTETVFKKGLLFLKERKCFQRKLHQLILGCFHQLGVYVQEKNEFLHCTTMLHFLQEYYVIWSETARASKMPCISFCVFFFDLFLPAGSIVFHEMGVRSFMKFVLHVYMLKNISREVTCQENAFYWTESGTLWDESACWKVCSCQLFVYSRKNVTLIFIIL
jgi:hypothetical protein